MSRENVNPNFKFGDSDGFRLTDIDTDESLMLIPCDTAGNFSWTGVTRAPLQRNAMQTSTTNNQYSDLEKPWISIPQEDWTGGRANDIFTKDTTRYRDGKRCQTSFNQVIYNAPLEHYSEGFRKAVTNFPGNVHWKKVTSGNSLVVKFHVDEAFTAGEVSILLRRRGTPVSPLVVSGIGNGHSYTIEEITDTVSEFKKFVVSAPLSTGHEYTLTISCDSGYSNDYWEVGCTSSRINGVPYFRVAESQEGYRTRFFMYEQIMFMVRQKPNGTPRLWMNGDICKTSAADEMAVICSGKNWKTNQWSGARVGLVYGHGIEGQVSVWRAIVSNTADTLTIDEPWDVVPQAGSVFIIVDTPIWTEITGHGLTSAVTDVHVIRGVVYFCQGDYTPIVKMRWHDGTFEWFTFDGICGSFLQSVRDSSGMMLYIGRNDDDQHLRSIERARLVDWEVPNIKPIFSETKDYIKGDIVVYDNKWYRFLLDHPAGEWIIRDAQEIVFPPEDIPDSGHYDDDTGEWIDEPGFKKDFTPPDEPEGTFLTIISDPLSQIDPFYSNSVDFGSGDFDAKQYMIDICKWAAALHDTTLAITLQESENNLMFVDVQTVTVDAAGRFFLTAKCQHRYRRLKFVTTGTGSPTHIRVKTSQKLRFVDRITLLDNYGKITRLFEYGAEQYKNLWIVQEGMLSSINKLDGTKDTYTLDRINIDELATTAEEWNGSAMSTTDVYLAWGWLNGLQRYYNTQLEGKGPDHDEGLPFDRQGRVTQIVSYPSNMFISIKGDEGYSCVMQFNQSGWAELYRSPNVDEPIYDMAFQPIYGNRPDRLWIQVGDDVIWLSMPSKILYALQDKNAEYTHESVIVSAWHTAGMMDIEKLWQSLKIMADYLDGKTCWIEADYQLDEENVWHPIKNLYTDSPSHKEDLSTNSVNGKKLRYRLRLQTNDIHKTPKVNAVVLEAVGRIDIKQSYTFYFRNIKYKRDLTGEFEDIEPLDVQNLLDEWANKLKKLRLNSRWLIYDNKIVYLDGVQTSVLNELSEGYIAQISLNEL